LLANQCRATLARMRATLVVLASAAAALLGAHDALASDGSVVAVDLPLHGDRIPTAPAHAAHFTLVGIHWRGSGSVSFRIRHAGGGWSSWRRAAPEDDAPDAGSPEAAARRGWRMGSPWWVGPSDRVETRTSGRVTRVRAYLVESTASGLPSRVPTATERPVIAPRLSWRANEAIRRAPPIYAPKLRFAIVHHTAGANGYSRAQAPAVVRAIELYHVKGNGWNDIGYNFLVDRFGTIYEGRYGGIDRNVVGAHALGFNTGSVGVAVLGSYGGAAPSQAAQAALARLLAWRLDLAHVDPTSTLTATSGGSERYPAGRRVTLRAISGHRDTGLTECPGDALYRRLDAIAAEAREIGGPKIFAPRVEVASSGQVRFRARLSSSLQWTVSIADGDGNVVAGGRGTGTDVDWTWDAAAPQARYRWQISAGKARPAMGPLRAGIGTAPASLAVQGLRATPSVISPNGDGQADTSLLAFTLTAPAYVSVDVFDAEQNAVLSVLSDQRLLAGKQTVLVDGSTLADGSYTVSVSAVGDDGSEVATFVPLSVSRVLGVVSAAPFVFSPNGDGRRDTLRVDYDLAAPADVRIQVLRDGAPVATLLTASLPQGHQRFVWDGTTSGARVRDGAYTVAVEATAEAGPVAFSAPFTVDTTAPVVRVLSLRPLRLAVSEPAVLKLRVDGVFIRREVKRARTLRIPLARPLRRLQVTAWDDAGNASEPVVAVAPKARKPRQ
jgi:flagellar hook assembly protein FlgD